MKNLLLGLLPLFLLACQSTGHSRFHVSEGDSLEVVFDRVHTSVVTIQTIGRTSMLDDKGAAVLAGGIGSGVLVDKKGLIMTAAHVVQTAEALQVEFVDGTTLPARILGTVPVADLALVQVEGDVPDWAVAVPLADSAQAKIGSRVFVIGAPRGISHTLTVGHMSARRLMDIPLACRCPVDLIQTDAAINKGNSGGPLFNMRGEVLGIVSHIVSTSGGNEGLGFAIGSDAARVLLLENDIFWSGVESVTIEGMFARAFNLPMGKSGALVQTVARGSLGDRLGLKGGTISASIEGQDILIGGDVLLEVQGISVGEPDAYAQFQEAFSKLEPADLVRVKILRGGSRLTLRRSLEELTAVE